MGIRRGIIIDAGQCYDEFDFGGYDGMDDPVASESPFDFREAFILGGMIVGQAYEEALDDKEQEKRNKDADGEDLDSLTFSVGGMSICKPA